MKKLFILAFVALLSAQTTTIDAQVTIGTNDTPVAGALLQIKQNESTTTNSNYGLGMPRVELTDKTNLYPMFAPNGANYQVGAITYTKTDEDAKHIGLLVYNSNNCFSNGSGLYVWSGTEWQNLNEDDQSLEGMAKKLDTAEDVIATNGVAWHKDHEGNIFFSMNYDAANPMGNTNRWMTTNLATKTYAPRTDGTPWSAPTLANDYANSSSVAYWGYPNPEGTSTAGLSTTYDARPRLGLLYNYPAATGGQNQNPTSIDQGNIAHTGVQGICPKGWHLPTNLEWMDLETKIKANASKYSGLPDNTANSGFAMMDMCEPTIGQNSSNTILNGGFSALLTGYGTNGLSGSLGVFSFFWTSSSKSIANAWCCRVLSGTSTMDDSFTNQYRLQSVRCKKDADSAPVVPTTCPNMTDADGNVYPTKAFGSQCWTTQNLRTTKASDGSALSAPKINPGFNWQPTGAIAVTSNWMTSTTMMASPINMTQKDFATKYGALYTWADANNVCPTGWHLPSNAEWTTLGTTLGGVATAGTKLKADNETYYNRNGTSYAWGGNEPGSAENSGFNAYPSGYVTPDNELYNYSYYSYWWTNNTNTARSLRTDLINLDSYAYFSASQSFSVRCLKD